jgi:hypothetical protein
MAAAALKFVAADFALSLVRRLHLRRGARLKSA